MKKLRESKSDLMSRSVDEMTKSWDALRSSLFRDGWMEPEATLTEADGQMLVGERIYVMGYGAGRVKEFVHARVGASKHVVELDAGAPGGALHSAQPEHLSLDDGPGWARRR